MTSYIASVVQRSYPLAVRLSLKRSSKDLDWQGFLVEEYELPEVTTHFSSYPFYSVCLTRKGAASWLIQDGVRHIGYPGHLVILPPYFAYSIHAMPGTTILGLHLESNLVSLVLGRLGCPDGSALASRFGLSDEMLEEILGMLIEQTACGDEPASSFAGGLVHSFVTRLIDLGGLYSTGSDLCEGIESGCIAEAVSYIESHLSEDLTVDELASKLRLSTVNFIKLFKSEMGITPYRYIGERRAERALHLLRRKIPLQSVARQVGFRTPSAFIRSFRRRTGLTPHVCRASLDWFA